jgi:hypothetical protein
VTGGFHGLLDEVGLDRRFDGFGDRRCSGGRGFRLGREGLGGGDLLDGRGFGGRARCHSFGSRGGFDRCGCFGRAASAAWLACSPISSSAWAPVSPVLPSSLRRPPRRPRRLRRLRSPASPSAAGLPGLHRQPRR